MGLHKKYWFDIFQMTVGGKVSRNIHFGSIGFTLFGASRIENFVLGNFDRIR